MVNPTVVGIELRSVTTANKAPPPTPNIPIWSRAAWPRASILHSNAMFRRSHFSIKISVLGLICGFVVRRHLNVVLSGGIRV